MNELEKKALLVIKAAKLSQWLIEKKGVKKKTAYIIAKNKFKIDNYAIIRKVYQKLKPKQDSLF